MNLLERLNDFEAKFQKQNPNAAMHGHDNNKYDSFVKKNYKGAKDYQFNAERNYIVISF